MNTYYKGEVGRPVVMQTGMDWTGHTGNSAIKILRPDGTNVVKTTSEVFVNDALSGVVSFNTVVSDFNQTGWYHIQAKLVTASKTLYSRIDSFMVEDAA